MILKNDVLREQDLLELLVRVEIGNVLQKSRNHLVKRASVCVGGDKVGQRRTSNQNTQAGPVQRKLFFHSDFFSLYLIA